MPPTLLQHPEAVLGVTLEELVGRSPDSSGAFFVQVGAFDGHANDPLHDLVVTHNWRGVLVEPQKRQFDRLQVTYASQQGLTFRNVAVGSRDEARPFYRLDDGAPAWAQQMASFDPEEDAAPVAGMYSDIIADTVQCVTFETLLEGVRHVDLLQIDAEGHDSELVQLFDFERWTPRIVQFEHFHLSHSSHDLAVLKLLRSTVIPSRY